MNINNFLSCTVLLSFFVQNVNAARVLVVSDIDDTIKNSHVLNQIDAIKNAYLTGAEMSVSGMANLYQSIKRENSEIEFHYVSNAPADLGLDISHGLFLDNNSFPINGLHTKQYIFRGDHKLRAIRTLIDIKNPDVVIMIGDNGEQDASVQNQIVNEYANNGAGIRFVQFIREAYSLADGGSRLRPGQTGFITPSEIAVQLADEKLLKTETAMSLVKNDLSKPNLNLAYWVDCRDHRLLPEPKNEKLAEYLVDLNREIKTTCRIK